MVGCSSLIFVRGTRQFCGLDLLDWINGSTARRLGFSAAKETASWIRSAFGNTMTGLTFDIHDFLQFRCFHCSDNAQIHWKTCFVVFGLHVMASFNWQGLLQVVAPWFFVTLASLLFSRQAVPSFFRSFQCIFHSLFWPSSLAKVSRFFRNDQHPSRCLLVLAFSLTIGNGVMDVSDILNIPESAVKSFVRWQTSYLSTALLTPISVQCKLHHFKWYDSCLQ